MAQTLPINPQQKGPDPFHQLITPNPQQQDQYGNPVPPINTATPEQRLPQGPANNNVTPYPVITTTPAVPPTLSFQAAVGKALQPAINRLGGTQNLSTLNQSLAGLPYAAAANSAIPNLSQGIASTLQGQIADYKSGLNSMLSQVGTATPLQDILKGMGELLSYPTATTLTGSEGAPGGVSNNSTLQEVYQELANLRNGNTLLSGIGGAGSGYGANPLQTATGS